MPLIPKRFAFHYHKTDELSLVENNSPFNKHSCSFVSYLNVNFFRGGE